MNRDEQGESMAGDDRLLDSEDVLPLGGATAPGSVTAAVAHSPAPADRSPVERELPFLLATLRDLASVARRLDVTGFQSRSTSDIERELVPLVARLLAMGVTVLDKLVALFESVEEGTAEFDFDVGATDPLDSDEPGLADLCVIGRMEMFHRSEELQRPLGDVDPWDAIARCNVARGALIKVAVAVESAICERQGWTPTLSKAQDSRRSIAVRRAYVDLRRAVGRIGIPNEERVGEALARVAVLIRELFDSEVADQIRVSDRCQLRRLLLKIEEWQSAGGDADSRSGLFLWQDVVAVVEMLLQINNREDLVEHDARQASRLLADTESFAWPECTFTPEQIEALETLYGRSPGLDALIDLLREGVRARVRCLLEEIVAGLPPADTSRR